MRLFLFGSEILFREWISPFQRPRFPLARGLGLFAGELVPFASGIVPFVERDSLSRSEIPFRE